MAVRQCLGIFHSVVLIAVLTVFLFQITNVSPTESPQEIDRKQRSQSSSKDSTDQPSSSLENSKVSLFFVFLFHEESLVKIYYFAEVLTGGERAERVVSVMLYTNLVPPCSNAQVNSAYPIHSVY